MTRRKKIKLKIQKPVDLMEIEPYGVTTSADQGRPVILFRHVGGEEVLPVYLSSLDAGIAISQHGYNTGAGSPHDVTLRLLEKLGVKLDRCVFTEVRGHHQYVELEFTGSKKVNKVNARADQSISFALAARAKFFCTKKYIEESRTVASQMNDMKQVMKKDSNKNRHPYLN